ncbi:MAG: YafY family transcriptional regulator, partial [Actinobacteria bacterium]|nr:YafY family transcriptional regulator [Actinomycetota bacterium]
WRGSELAERLEVTERSIRRDITRLRSLGYPVDSVTGMHGGYSLAAGGRLPPLLLDDDDAVSIAVALHDIARRSTDAVAQSALGALTKLGQVMPASLRERVSALSDVVVGVGAAPDPFAEGSTEVDVVMALGLACSRNERTRFDYRSAEGVDSTRHVEPFRLVSVGRRWYLVAFDIDRVDWRTFRLDRISRVRTTGARFVRTDPPDAAEFVAMGIAVSSYELRAIVRFAAPAEVVARHVPPTIGVIRRDAEHRRSTIVEMGGDPDWIARYLAGSSLEYEVIEPEAVRDELRRLGEALVARNAVRADAAARGPSA